MDSLPKVAKGWDQSIPKQPLISVQAFIPFNFSSTQLLVVTTCQKTLNAPATSDVEALGFPRIKLCVSPLAVVNVAL